MADTNVVSLVFRRVDSGIARRRIWLRPDGAFRAITALSASTVVFVLVAMVAVLGKGASHGIATLGASFVTGRHWDPSRLQFGSAPFIFGTLVSSTLALAIAVPIALGIALTLSEWSPQWLRGPLGVAVELMAAVPSVVYGLWGILVLVPFLRDCVEPILAQWLGFLPWFQGPQLGFGMLAGAVLLSIMIIPTVASVVREVMVAVPPAQREGALALGATKWEAVRIAVLPYARSGIIGAALLGLGRAVGETMAITMVIGNRAEISSSLFAPSYTMASVLANEYAEATNDLHWAALMEIALLLLVVTLMLNILARALVWRVTEGAR